MLKNIYDIVKRELKNISQDIDIKSIILLAPIFYALFYGTIYINKVERDLPIVVYDEDHSEMSKKLTRLLDAHDMLKVSESVPDFQTGVNKINSEEARAMVYFPKNFESDLKLYKGSTVKLYINTTRFLVSNDINIAANEVIMSYNSDIKLKFFEKAGYSYEQSNELIEPVKYDMRPMFNFTESYGDFLVPGILALIIQQTLLIGLSESFSKEREMKTLGELYKLSGKNIFTVIHGKGLFYGILFSAYSFLFFTFTFSLFKLNMAGSIIALSIFTFLLITAVIYLSILFASFIKRKLIAVQFLALTSYPIFLISGYSWPAQAMPVWVQYLSKLLPSTPYLSAFVRITQMGAGLNETLPELLHMIILTLILYLMTHLRLKTLFKQLTQ